MTTESRSIWMPGKGHRELFRALKRTAGEAGSIADLTPNRASVKMLLFNYHRPQLFVLNADPDNSRAIAAVAGGAYSEIGDDTAALPASIDLGVVRDIKNAAPGRATCVAAGRCSHIAVIESASWRIRDLADQLMRFGLGGVEFVRSQQVRTPDLPAKLQMIALFRVVE